jgi:hypothetical protein
MANQKATERSASLERFPFLMPATTLVNTASPCLF